MTSTSHSALRHYSRVPFDAQVLLHLAGKSLRVHLLDIALKGALVETDAPQALALQEVCRLELPLAEGGEGVEMQMKIVHLNGCLVGLECQKIDVTSLTRLRRLLELNTGDTARMHRELLHMFANP